MGPYYLHPLILDFNILNINKSKTRVSFRTLIKNPIHLLSFGLGLGLSPIAPGTFGTLAALPVYWLIRDIGLSEYLMITVVMFAIGIYLCEKTSSSLAIGDHSGIVFDEIVGLLVALMAIPFSFSNLLLGFVVFRFFDALKPWPIRVLDRRVHGGLGIMLDDLAAGLMANLAVRLAIDVKWPVLGSFY